MFAAWLHGFAGICLPPSANLQWVRGHQLESWTDRYWQYANVQQLNDAGLHNYVELQDFAISIENMESDVESTESTVSQVFTSKT